MRIPMTKVMAGAGMGVYVLRNPLSRPMALQTTKATRKPPIQEPLAMEIVATSNAPKGMTNTIERSGPLDRHVSTMPMAYPQKITADRKKFLKLLKLLNRGVIAMRTKMISRKTPTGIKPKPAFTKVYLCAGGKDISLLGSLVEQGVPQ